MTDTTDKERDLKVAADSLKHSCLRLNKYQNRATVDIEDVELVLIALEAERQRADYGQQVLDQRNAECDRLINEISALKGDQVPVAWTDAEELRGMEKDGCGYLFKVDPANPFADPRRQIMLYDHPQKPVVLPSPYYGDRHCLDKREVIAAIEAAGGIVTSDHSGDGDDKVGE